MSGATGRVRSGDVEIFYRTFGEAGRTPVIIVHGLSYFSYDWIEAATLIAKDREVAAIDMRGFGESGWSPARDYKLETLTNDLVAVLDALGWSKAVLMGHSFGGRVALATAGWKPERAAALVLVDFAPDIAAAGRKYTAQRIGGHPDVFASVEEAMAYDHEAPADPKRRARWEAFLQKTDKGYALKRDLHFRDNFRKALESGQSAPVPAFLWPMLTDTKIPTMVVRGSESNMFDAVTLDKVKQINPRATAIELAGSHDLAGDNPEGLARAVSEFLDASGL
ncbi:MAG: alpha/beta fold hydrolase [Pseudolabrys sp.]